MVSRHSMDQRKQRLRRDFAGVLAAMNAVASHSSQPCRSELDEHSGAGSRSTVTRFVDAAGRAAKRVDLDAPWQQSAARATRLLWRRGNVAMLHAGRCGSTVVGEMLGDHPRVQWAGEIFEGMQWQSPRRADVTAHIERSCYATLSPYYGFETKFLPQHHLSADGIDMELADYLELLRSLHFSKFILLGRRNYLRRAVSTVVARARDEWHTKVAPVEATRVHLDVNAFQTGNCKEPLVDAFRRMDDDFALARRLLQGDHLLELESEEDVLDDPTVAYRKVCQFVGIEPRKARVKLQRTNPFPYDALIDNLDEVTAVLRDTPYAWMLDS